MFQVRIRTAPKVVFYSILFCVAAFSIASLVQGYNALLEGNLLVFLFLSSVAFIVLLFGRQIYFIIARNSIVFSDDKLRLSIYFAPGKSAKKGENIILRDIKDFISPTVVRKEIPFNELKGVGIGKFKAEPEYLIQYISPLLFIKLPYLSVATDHGKIYRVNLPLFSEIDLKVLLLKLKDFGVEIQVPEGYFDRSLMERLGEMSDI